MKYSSLLKRKFRKQHRDYDPQAASKALWDGPEPPKGPTVVRHVRLPMPADKETGPLIPLHFK